MFPFQVFKELQPTLAGGFKNLGQVIRSLFAANEHGVWYDPSDLSTLFQDPAGTTPVTAVEQPVGLMLDKSNGLTLGPELVTNGTFDTADGWTLGTGWSIANGVASYSGSLNTNRLEQTRAGQNGKTYKVTLTFTMKNTPHGNAAVAFQLGGVGQNVIVYSQRSLQNGQTYTLTGYGTPTTVSSFKVQVSSDLHYQMDFDVDNISVRELPGNHASQPTATSRPVLSARVNQYLATETLATQNVTTLAAQYRLSFEGTGTVTLSGTATGAYSAGSHLITCTAGTLTSTVSGSVTKADLRVANTGAGLPAYQRVNTATDYDTVGFPHYLRFDGVDDGMVTNTITPGIDKVQVFAGVRKLSDAAQGVVAELSATIASNNGTFLLAAPDGATQTYGWDSKGTTQVDAVATSIAAPITSVVTGLADISGDSAIIRVNGAVADTEAGDQGTGNYLAYPLYIGRRSGSTLPFNGHLYSLIVRFGSNLPTTTIEKIEKYINTKTRAY